MLRVCFAYGLASGARADDDEHVSLLQTVALKRHVTVEQTGACDDLCWAGESRLPEGLNGKCKKRLHQADTKPAKCEKWTEVRRNEEGKRIYSKVRRKCCKGPPCDNPCPEGTHLDTSEWNGKCGRKFKRAQWRVRLCDKLHGKSKKKKLQQKFAEKCCMSGTTTKDDTEVATTTTAAPTKDPKDPKDKEKKDKDKCMLGYNFVTGYTGSSYTFQQEANSAPWKCAKLCDKAPRCNGFEFLKSTKVCYLHEQPDPRTKSGAWLDAAFCQKPEDRRAGPCEEDYDQALGYVNGAGTVRDVGSILDTMACAELCNNDKACNSYEYWHTRKVCELNWNKDPNVGQGQERTDMFFCIKAPEDRAKVCKKGYELMEGQVGGGGQITTRSSIQDALECTELCDNDEACNSYEYSFRYERCELNYRPEPNAGSHWYDMHLCSKPEKRRAAPCPSGRGKNYDYKLGQLSGYQFVTKTSVTTLEACAALCEEDGRCNSFEYSQTHDRCELNNADIPNAESEWYDMKFCQKPEARRPVACPEEYGYIYGRVPGGGSKQRLTSIATTADCAVKCDELEECRSYEYDVMLRYCDLNWQPAPTHNDTENNFKFCSKDKSNRATSCKGKYTRKEGGQIPGHGQILYKDGITADACAEMCDADGGCNSYEYSHMYNRCEQNYRHEPSSQTTWYDMVFCEKAEDDREPACNSNYEYKTGQLSGGQYLTLTLHTMEECAEKCTGDARCNSYEYSWKYNRCELNNRDETNSASEWYDMKFCYKPEDMRDPPCAEDYEQVEGQISGAQVKTIGSVVNTRACSELCHDDEACMSYEYSVMGRACELHWSPKPTSPTPHAGYVFCQKAEEDRAKTCKKGFKFMAGQFAGASADHGHMSVTTGIKTADECADKCKDDGTCFAYEFSQTYDRCELLWRPIPNAVSTWYDMRFCQKPEKDWATTCESDYEYVIGRMQGTYLTRTSYTAEKCVQDCDEDPRCNQYGFSEKYKYCWFSSNDVPSANIDYYDMKLCVKPEAKRPKNCAKNYDYIFGRVPGGGFRRTTRSATMMNTDHCAKLCDDEEGCRSYEYDLHLGYCDMNYQAAPTHNDTENQFKFCSKKENHRATSCKDNYVKKVGQIPGGGQVSTLSGKSAEECVQMCDEEEGCNSYEYSHVYNQCQLNYQIEPSSTTLWYDMIFCQKAEDERAPFCADPYEYKTGQRSGSQYATLTLDTMEKCSEKCTEDPRCNSYEYSHKYNRCELNNLDTVSHQSEWYDMKFCYKPLSMRDGPCAEEYEEVEGYTPGAQVKTIGSVVDTHSCAQLCHDEDACRSYEYSVMGRACELHWKPEPTHTGVHAGYVFCQMADADRAKSCKKGFELLAGQRIGAGAAEGHMDVTTLQTADECAEKCDDDEWCYAYEYSHTYNRCERMWRPEPNAASTWYDMRFCQKPKKKWNKPCELDYEYKVGKAPSPYTLQNSVSAEQCVELCNKDPRCNVYGYSPKYRYCWGDDNEPVVFNTDYYDMKFCVKPEGRRPKDCASNYDYIFGRVPGGGSFKRLTRTTDMMNVNDCGKKCDEDDGCRSYEYEVTSGYCDLNYQPVPTHNDTEGTFKFCSKKENDRAPSCVGDYVRKSGQFGGGGSIATGHGTSEAQQNLGAGSVEKCAELCDADGGCNSYEYSHIYKRCERNYAADPSTQTTWVDQVFCQKPEARRAPPCDDERYEYKTGQLSGQQYLTLTIQSNEECAEKCTADARCNSYEYSWRYRRCELNHPDVTNTESLWYDMKFCWKPLDMRTVDCGEEYDEVIGSVSGGGSIRAVAAVKDAIDCATLCDEEDACMSYEYSVMAQRCELNWNKEPNTPAIAAGYHLCQKAPDDRASVCVNGYELLYGQYNNGGGAMIGAQKSNIEKAEDCAKFCDDDKACYSYEYSATYKRCEINAYPEPNVDSHWYDMRFCQKPKKKQEPMCEGDYSYKLGQMSGSQFLTQTITSASQCAKNCDNDSRCNAYEFSQRYNRCELNYMDTTNSLTPWYDMKFCAKAPKKQQKECAKDYDYLWGRVPGGGAAGRVTNVMTTEDCAKKCDDNEACRAYEYDPRIRYCDMNYQPAPTHNDTENNFKFCSKKKNEMATSCRDDYVRMEGQIPGHGQIRYQDSVDADKCADMCDKEANCYSYEYSHLYNRCELNYRPIPTTPTKWYDMVFCQKPEARQPAACLQGYEYLPGQLSGQQFLTVTLYSMKECGQKCTQDARCNSYEYSFKYKRCELNNNPLTNAASEWYDMKFCQKVEEDREPPCSEDYVEVEGYIPSSQVRAVSSVADTHACSKLCNDETACKSYEYSIMAKRCELNWELKPTVGVQTGYHLCVKDDSDREKACQNGYELLEGQVNGNQYATLTLEDPADCAKECDKAKECNSYEFSFTYNRCELNWRPEPNHASHWYDMRTCSKPKAKRDDFCPGGYIYSMGQLSGQQFSTLTGITSAQQCMSKCDADARCNSFEYSAKYDRCELNWPDVINANSEWYDMKFCAKPENKRESECGKGYDNLYGRVPGSGFRRVSSMQTTEDCAKQCNNEEGCRSYEYHVMGKYCDMNYQPLPTQNFTEAGFNFCSKSEKDRAESCKRGYELKDGQLAGYQYVTQYNIDADTCAKNCDADKQCNSYEYSHVYNRCELNWRSEPNSYTRWYDLKFCTKPAAKRQAFCDGEYTFHLGQLGGQQFATLTLGSMKDCAKECNKDPRCNSYEYSVKYSRCELNHATAPNNVNDWYDLKFCTKPEDLRAIPCDDEYEYVEGQFNGGGNIKTVGSVLSTDACAALCNDDTACKSYEYSVMARSCQMNWATDINNNVSAAGYHFCKKESENVKKVCLGEYVMMPGQVSGGGQMDTTTLDTVDACRDKCDEDEACNSYEYSMTYNRCERNYRPMPNHEGHWYDMKFCAKPDSKQKEPCLKGYKYFPGQLNGAQFLTVTKNSAEECVDACNEDARCNSYEFSLKYKRCELNSWDNPNHPNEWYDMKFCQKPMKQRLAPCAKEYTHLRGQISGNGQIMTHSNNVEIQTTEECAEACDDDHGCNSYEFSVLHKQCHMNYDAEPNKEENYIDFTFCQKGADDMYQVCQKGYEQMPGQLSGYQYLTLTVELPEECAGLCDDDDECYSYEFSHKYNRCELNWRPEPSHNDTYWYDMKFCSKPEDRRADICTGDYTFVLGQVSGSQYITRTTITLAECGKLCDDDKRCNSYEYSQKYDRCELNYHVEPTATTEWYDMKMCVKSEEERAPDCAGAYEFKDGQITATQISVTGNILGSEACATMCNENHGCKSYEYSFLAKQCQLNWDAEPNSETPQAGLFKFCTKHADNQTNMCGGDYTPFPGQNSQGPYLTKTSFEDGPDGCRQLCDEDEQCFAYEYSFKYKRCELNWRTEPNTESRWYDLQFCQKPKNKWPEVCADGYEFKEGQTNAQYEVKTNIHEMQGCADYCSNEERCFSYEFSPKYQRCELNTVAEPNIPTSNWYDLKFCSKKSAQVETS